MVTASASRSCTPGVWKNLPSGFGIWLLLLLSLCFLPASGAAQEFERQRVRRADAEILDLSLARSAGVLEASFHLRDALGPELIARIDSGLPTTLTYLVRMERPRRWWWNRLLGRTELQIIAMYNAVTREYLVNFKQDGDLIDSQVVRSQEDLQRSMTQIDRLVLSRFDAPVVEGTMIRVRAELGSRNWLRLVPTTVHTPWAEVPLAEVSQVPPTPSGAPTTLR